MVFCIVGLIVVCNFLLNVNLICVNELKAECALPLCKKL